jgi:hypothetical protein
MKFETKKHVVAKALRLCLTVLGLFVLLGGGEAEARERVIYDYTGKAHRIPDIDYSPPVKLGGIAPKIVRERTPLELINPFASRDHGFGRGLVSWNQQEGKPKGFIILGIKIW